MDDCGGFESRYTSGYRGFESHSLRQRKGLAGRPKGDSPPAEGLSGQGVRRRFGDRASRRRSMASPRLAVIGSAGGFDRP